MTSLLFTSVVLIAVLPAMVWNCPFTQQPPISLPVQPTPHPAANKKCYYLKNVHYGEYLYNGSPDQAFDAESNRVFTWRRKSDGPASNWGSSWGNHYRYQGMWLVEKKTTVCSNCYEIKSLYYKNHSQPLYSEWFNPVRAQSRPPFNAVYTYRRPGSVPKYLGRHIWVLEKLPNGVRIKNFNLPSDENKENYLYASSNKQAYDKDRRNVFTGTLNKSSNNNKKQLADWVMESAVCPLYLQ